MKKFLAILAVLSLALNPSLFAITSVQDDGTYEGDYTTINFSTGMSGAASTTNPSVYVVTGGPVGSDGNWTGDGTTTTLDAAATKFILTHSTGTSFADIGDFDQINLENDAAIDNAVNGTVTIVEGGDTLSFAFDGDDIDLTASDGGLVFNTTASDSTGTFDFCARADTNDCLVLDTISNVPTIATDGTSNLGLTPDGGTVVVTGILTVSGAQSLAGATTITSHIIGDDTYDVVVDDEHRFTSNDETAIVEAMGFEAKSAAIQITSDEGDEAGDKWQLVSDHATSSLFFTNDIGVKDTHATVLTMATNGTLTTTNDINIVNNTSTTDAVQDVLSVVSESTGTAAAGLGVGISFEVEDAGAASEQQGSIDVATTTATDGAEDADMIFSINTAGTIAEVGRFVAASSGTTGDSFTLTQNTTETNAILDILSFANVTGTAANDAGLGITWDFEDAGGAEEQASLDVQLSDATNAAELVDIIFSQQTDGTVRQTLKLTGRSSAIESSNIDYTGNTLETNGVVNIMYLKLDNTADTATDNYGMAISFQLEDETGVEERASLDIVQTTGARATNDTDFIFTQDVNGTLTERVRFDADGGNILLSGAIPGIVIGDAGDEDAYVRSDQSGQDYIWGVDATDDEWHVAAGSALGTNNIISIDSAFDATFGDGSGVEVTTLYSTQYVQLPYVDATGGRPASGAKAGAMITIYNAQDANDCGATSVTGTTFVVCVSDGTNWKALDFFD